MKRLLAPSLLCLLTMAHAEPSQTWERATRTYHWSFPRDHWPHRNFQTEWWYFTGHLKSRDNPPREFGYQSTFFRIGLLNEKPAIKSDWATSGLIMGHAAVLDVRTGTHVFSSVLFRESPLLGQFNDNGKNPIAWSEGPAGSDGKWTLEWNGHAFDFRMNDRAKKIAFDLSTTPLKPLIFQGPNGFSQKDKTATSASLYYSFTRLATKGTITFDGAAFDVDGVSWMDKEFSSNTVDKGVIGWDWFSLQFDDGRELMLYYLRGQNGEPDFARGTWIEKNPSAPTAIYLESTEWTLTTDRHWTSPHSKAAYPSEWTLDLPSYGIRCRIQPVSADQENRGDGPGLPYWEGAVRLIDMQNRPIGRGFVELTGRTSASSKPR